MRSLLPAFRGGARRRPGESYAGHVHDQQHGINWSCLGDNTIFVHAGIFEKCGAL